MIWFEAVPFTSVGSRTCCVHICVFGTYKNDEGSTTDCVATPWLEAVDVLSTECGKLKWMLWTMARWTKGLTKATTAQQN